MTNQKEIQKLIRIPKLKDISNKHNQSKNALELQAEAEAQAKHMHNHGSQL